MIPTKYIHTYRAQTQTIDTSLKELERLIPTLGPTVQSQFEELKSAIDTWHRDPDT
jgi:hypothetical protein